LLAPSGALGYSTLALGSALALFLYPHSVTAVLAARDRNTIRRNMAALPAYSIVLGLIALLGYMAIAAGVKPVVSGGTPDTNTVVPVLFHNLFPGWFAGIAFAAIAIGALVPAAIMSIAAANLFTRNVYREYLRPGATPAEEARVSRIASLVVKAGALIAILLLDPEFSIDLQLIGGVVILQTLPAVVIGLYSRWAHRWGLLLGWAAGLVTGLVAVYSIPNPKAGNAHFGGSALPLSDFGWDTKRTIYAGFLALAVNLAVMAVATVVLRALHVADGRDATRAADYLADAGAPGVEPEPFTPDQARRAGWPAPAR
jgi:SSS family solute:Na+ symporter